MGKYTYDPNGTPYHLQGSKHTCPSCGKHTLQLYINATTGEPINDHVGKCDRLYNCGYDYKPKDYYNDHPNELPILPNRGGYHTIKQDPPKPLVTIPTDYVTKSLVNITTHNQCDFVDMLTTMFCRDDVERVCNLYYLGRTKERSVIFWQIDENGLIHEGKAMAYNFASGSREKSSWVTGESKWIFNTLKGRGILPEKAESTKILFGQHLLRNADNHTNVCIVESEKNAIFGSLAFPQCTWVATGSAVEFGKVWNVRAILALCRSIIVVPDADAYQDWHYHSKRLNLPNLKVWDICKGHASGYDIADYIRNYWIQDPHTIKAHHQPNKPTTIAPSIPMRPMAHKPQTPSCKATMAHTPTYQIERMKARNPIINELIEALDLVVVEE